MIDGLKPYISYRESGQKWIGDLPSEWTTVPLCRISRLKTECNRPDLELLSVYLNLGVIRYSESQGQVHKPSLDLSRYQVVSPGDFVLNNQQAWRGSIGVSKYHGIVSPAYVVLAVSGKLRMGYANELLRSPAMVAQFVTASRGVGDIQRNLYYPDLRRVTTIVPPQEDQEAIERFLSHFNRRIETFVRMKRKLISNLNEQKQSTLHRSVTRGLDSDTDLMPSRISWLDEVPAHWQVLRSKYLFREIDERSEDGKETHLSMSQKLGLVPNTELTSRRLISDSYAGAKLCNKGDLVLNRLKAHLGVFALAPQPGLVSPDYTVLRPIRELESRYFEALYRSPGCRGELRRRAKGIVQGFWRLYTDDFYDIRVPVPPLDEQTRIMNYLEGALVQQNTAIARVEREIALIREYRRRLTADIVTGKLDVREAASKLPDLSPEAGKAPDGETLGEEDNFDSDIEDVDE